MRTTSAALIPLVVGLAFLPILAEANSGDFSGGVAIGTSYAGTDTAPTNGLIVQGSVGIGTTTSSVGLDVEASSNTPVVLRNTNSTSGDYWQVGPDGNSNFLVYNQSGTGVWLASGGTGWNSSSDKRLKSNITPLTGALTKLSAIKGVTFHWKDKSEAATEHIGVIAQDVQTVYPQLVGTDYRGMLGVDYAGLVVPLIEAVKELKADNDKLRRDFDAYKDAHPHETRQIPEQ